MKRKSEAVEEGVEKRSICAPKEVFAGADAVMKDRMIDSFSEYVRTLIRKDLLRSNTKKAA